MKTVSQLKIAVAGFMQRNPSSFVRTVGNETVDLLLVACNNARLYAERLVDFELSKVDVAVECTLADGGNINFATELEDENAGVGVKKIITPFIAMDSTGNKYPVDLWSRKRWNDRLKRRYEGVQPTDAQNPMDIEGAQLCVVQDGPYVFVFPASTQIFTQSPFNLYFNVVSWLPEYVDGTEDDFILENCFDWMMFYCISQLNFFLKEDERVAISASMLSDTWSSVIKWNNELIASCNDDTDLD